MLFFNNISSSILLGVVSTDNTTIDDNDDNISNDHDNNNATVTNNIKKRSNENTNNESNHQKRKCILSQYSSPITKTYTSLSNITLEQILDDWFTFNLSSTLNFGDTTKTFRDKITQVIKCLIQHTPKENIDSLKSTYHPHGNIQEKRNMLKSICEAFLNKIQLDPKTKSTISNIQKVLKNLKS